MKIFTLSLFGLLLFSFCLRSQERVVLSNDRDIYIAGEELWFNVVLLHGQSNHVSDMSKVVYVELMNGAGVPVVQSKLRLLEGCATSKLSLPDTLTTDNYLLRAYTRWMINYPVSCYAHNLVSVVNPFLKGSLPAVDAPERLKPDLSPETSDLRFARRQKVSLPVPQQVKAWEHVSVSVVKSSLYCGNSVQASDKKLNSEPVGALLPPELRSEILKAIVFDGNTGLPVQGEKYMLGFVSQNPDLIFATSDKEGVLRFEVDRYGTEEMVIQPYNTDTTKLQYNVKVEDQFSHQYAAFDLPPLAFDSVTIEGVNEAIINMQINTLYAAHYPKLAEADSIEKQSSFYGTPENTVLIDRYIELPNTEELIREILPYVSLRKSQGQYEIKVFEQTSLYPKEGKTMTFVDGVAINDVARILTMDPSYFERIEVINLNYYLEDENLGRLVNFITRQGDMGDLEFDQRIFRQVHQGYLNAWQYLGPDYTLKEVKHSRLADFRNLLYFGQLKREGGDLADVTFFTGDEATNYTVVFQGVNSEGFKEIVSRRFSVE
ncbi:MULTISPECIES: hypothetical protein [unclassified Carboxylicivirga]|uniref:hypothetical protein n=1 Tax=Carboxylicivirga TaxID=1628153 RepID=UPI003D34388F